MSTNVHSFSTTFNKNGNITISFYEATKQRHIKLPKGSAAAKNYSAAYIMLKRYDMATSGDESITNEALIHLRQNYNFKKHPNNPSIFYPKAKTSTLYDTIDIDSVRGFAASK